MGIPQVVITGVGIVSPIGIGKEIYWDGLLAGQCGIAPVSPNLVAGPFPQLFGEVRNFDPRVYVANRKSLKVMSRDAQLGIAASVLACREANLVAGKIDPDRFGVVLGADPMCAPIQESEATYAACHENGRFDFRLWGTKAMAASYPLNFLRVLPNMIASHVSIVHDARGPNNTIHQGEISSLLAVTEAAGVIERGMADVMLSGGASSQTQPLDFVRRIVLGNLSPRYEDPASVVRPFDAGRDGYVWSEGAALVVLENRSHAEARGARILGRLKSWASGFEPTAPGRPLTGAAIRRTITRTLDLAAIQPGQLSHVNTHGLSTVREDALEATVLADLLPDVPATALKGHLGNAGAAGAALEIAASVLALEYGLVPPTRNYQNPDPACPLRMVYGQPLTAAGDVLCLTWMPDGQAAALVMGR